jgi:hypothetical protein
MLRNKDPSNAKISIYYYFYYYYYHYYYYYYGPG